MPAYCLFDNLKITDPAKLERYKAAVAPVVAQYEGRYVVLGGQVERVEGEWAPAFPVLIEFPDLAKARQWYHSPEYRPLKALRQQAGSYNAVFLEEFPSASAGKPERA
jgi:uncharacterized protein (DUF1330 family)